MERPLDTRPIGVFDSGVGGLSILRHIAELLPRENLLYFADTAHCPYGARSKTDIRDLSEDIVRFLLARGAKIIVVACNTASAAALRYLRERFSSVPFVGMVPAVKPALSTTQSGIIGVLATETTFQGELFADVVSRFGGGADVMPQVCPNLVEHVECGDVDSPDVEDLLRQYMGPLLAKGADTIVLGCTHYPFLIPVMRRIVGDGVKIIEPGAAIARQTARLLERHGLAITDAHRAGCRVYVTSGDLEVSTKIVARLVDLPGEFLLARWLEGGPVITDLSKL